MFSTDRACQLGRTLLHSDFGRSFLLGNLGIFMWGPAFVPDWMQHDSNLGKKIHTDKLPNRQLDRAASFCIGSFGRMCPTAIQDDGRLADIPRAKGCVRHQCVLFPLSNMPAALGNRFLEIYRGNTVNTGEKGSKFQIVVAREKQVYYNERKTIGGERFWQ